MSCSHEQRSQGQKSESYHFAECACDPLALGTLVGTFLLCVCESGEENPHQKHMKASIAPPLLPWGFTEEFIAWPMKTVLSEMGKAREHKDSSPAESSPSI